MDLKKVLSFVLLFLWVMGIVGGIGYSIYGGAWPIAVGVAVAAWLSWPKVVELFHNLTD
jgi:MFS superfamily sulfate permease-like transporter